MARPDNTTARPCCCWRPCPLPDHTTGEPAHGSPCWPPALNPTASHAAGPTPAPGLPAAACCQTTPAPTRTLLFLVLTCYPGRYPHTTYPQTLALLAAIPPLPDHTTGEPPHGSPCWPPALNPTASHTTGPSPAPGLPAAACCQTTPAPTRTLLFLVLTSYPGKYPQPVALLAAMPAAGSHHRGTSPRQPLLASGPEPHRQPCRRANPRSGAPGCRLLPDLTTSRTPLFLVMTCRPGRYPKTTYPHGWRPCCRCRITPPPDRGPAGGLPRCPTTPPENHPTAAPASLRP